LCGLIGLHLDNCRIGRVAVRYDEETSSNVLGALPMQNVVLRFLLLFIPLCAAAIGLVWIGLHSHGFWSAISWLAAAVFGILALMQLIAFLYSLARVSSLQASAQQSLEEFEQHDAELFAQGKSFEEVISQYKQLHK